MSLAPNIHHIKCVSDRTPLKIYYYIIYEVIMSRKNGAPSRSKFFSAPLARAHQVTYSQLMVMSLTLKAKRRGAKSTIYAFETIAQPSSTRNAACLFRGKLPF